MANQGAPGEVASSTRQTRFRDVCGTVDELKRILHEQPASLAEMAPLESLVEDIPFMLGRMEERLAEYERFRHDVVALTAELQEIGKSRVPEAGAIAAELKAQLNAVRASAGHSPDAGTRDAAVSQGEALRDIAQDIENKLNRYMELALALARAYRDVKGGRLWVLDEAEAAMASLPGEPEWARWLPPSPHRERIVRWMESGRAHLVPVPALSAPEASADSEASPPLVQFQDGGLMRLPDVRWSEEVRTFYSSETPPDPRGRLYRDYDARRVFPAGKQRVPDQPSGLKETTS